MNAPSKILSVHHPAKGLQRLIMRLTGLWLEAINSLGVTSNVSPHQPEQVVQGGEVQAVVVHFRLPVPPQAGHVTQVRLGPGIFLLPPQR